MRMREAAYEARMGEPDAGVGVTLGADVAEGLPRCYPREGEVISDKATKASLNCRVVGERLSWRASSCQE